MKARSTPEEAACSAVCGSSVCAVCSVWWEIRGGSQTWRGPRPRPLSLEPAGGQRCPSINLPTASLLRHLQDKGPHSPVGIEGSTLGPRLPFSNSPPQWPSGVFCAATVCWCLAPCLCQSVGAADANPSRSLNLAEEPSPLAAITECHQKAPFLPKLQKH